MGRFLSTLDALLPASEPACVLEVGVGEGEIAGRVRGRFPAALVTGLDLADDGLGARWRQGGLAGTYGDTTRLPFRDHAFELVLAIEVLEHVGDPGSALAEIARVARGDVILSVPREPLWRVLNMARGRYLSALGNTPGHVQHWGRRGFVGLVAGHFEIVEVRQPVPWTVVRARAQPSSSRSGSGSSGACPPGKVNGDMLDP
jgi:SAM-dependent methyltransferase